MSICFFPRELLRELPQLSAQMMPVPSHHLVESVHFTANSGKAIHPALAVIQTPTREYFVLRDNGMEVGCEEDGVWEAWRSILACDSRGMPLTVAAR